MRQSAEPCCSANTRNLYALLRRWLANVETLIADTADLQRLNQCWCIKAIDADSQFRGELQRLSGLVNSAIDTVRLLKDAFIRGERKEELVSWWLELIESEVFKFLDQLCVS